MKFLSVCSGIEAASIALCPIDWECVAVAENDLFPSAVLAYRHPDVPNLGDITKYHEWSPTLRFRCLFGGTPCQGFSLAGLCAGLDDPRSQLAITFVEIAAKYRPAWLVWENVPGVLSINAGADFAAILAAFTGRDIQVPSGGWQNSGYVEGIAEAYGIAWRVLDAQHFGVPQRRRRVFVVGYLGDWRPAVAALFERESLSGNPPPSRGEREDLAGTLTASSLDGSSPCGGDGREGVLIASAEIAPTLDANYGRLQGCSGQDLLHGHGHLDAATVTSKWAKGSGRPSGDECHNLVTSQDLAPPLTGNPYGDHESREGLLVVGSPAAFAALDYKEGTFEEVEQSGPLTTSADRTRGGPIVAFNLRGREGGAMPEVDTDGLACQRAASGGSSRSYVGFDSTQITSPENRSNPRPGDPCHTLAKGAHPPAVDFTIHGTDSLAGEVASESELAQCLRAKTPGGIENSSTTVAVSDETYVRRLTPRECERLQGFPDDYTLIPGDFRPRKPKDREETVAYLMAAGFHPEEAAHLADHPDGCRYKALGNSKAVPFVRWIGERISAVDSIITGFPSNLGQFPR